MRRRKHYIMLLYQSSKKVCKLASWIYATHTYVLIHNSTWKQFDSDFEGFFWDKDQICPFVNVRHCSEGLNNLIQVQFAAKADYTRALVFWCKWRYTLSYQEEAFSVYFKYLLCLSLSPFFLISRDSNDDRFSWANKWQRGWGKYLKVMIKMMIKKVLFHILFYRPA